MHPFRVFVTSMAILWAISRWVFELAGEPAGELKRDPQAPQGVSDLRAELGGQLPEKIYNVFGRAVAQHRRKAYSSALHEYQKLRQIPSDEGPIDLHDHSRVFRSNWRMLRRDMNH